MRLPALYVPDVGPALACAVHFREKMNPAIVAWLLEGDQE